MNKGEKQMSNEEQCEVRESQKPHQKLLAVKILLIEPSHFLVELDYRTPKRIFHTIGEVLDAIEIKLEEINEKS